MRNNKDKGFTFIELILYMAILGIFMVAVVTLISSTVNTNRRQKAKQKLQTQATETYDAISGMLMGATDVKIVGVGYVGAEGTYTRTVAAGTEIKDINTVNLSCFVVPKSTDTKKDDLKLKSGSSGAPSYQTIWTGTGSSFADQKVSSCYDIADLKPLDEKSNVNDPETFVDTRFLWIQYASDYERDASSNAIVKKNNVANNMQAFCTITYDEQNKKLYIYRNEISENDYNDIVKLSKSSDDTVSKPAEERLMTLDKIVDGRDKDGTLLAKNVESFKLQVNPDDNSVALLISFKDNRTQETYDITGVVGLRNSFVLKKHEWNK